MRSLLVAVAVEALVIPLALHAQQGGVTAEGWEVRLGRGSSERNVTPPATGRRERDPAAGDPGT